MNAGAKVNEDMSSSTIEIARLLDAALPKGVSQGDMHRRDGDSSVYKFYLRSAGLLSPSIITATMIALAFCDGFPSKSLLRQIVAILLTSKTYGSSGGLRIMPESQIPI